jgi:hypothetical protein
MEVTKMKLTKENLIITLRLLKGIYQYNIKNMQEDDDIEDNELPITCGRLEMLEDIIIILTHEKEFERLSTALMKMTNRYGHDGSENEEDNKNA